MERDDERLREPFRERRHVLAVPSPEDPVLMLEQDDIDVQTAQDPGGAHIVAPDRLGDRRHEPRPLRAGRLVHDHDLLDAVDPVHSEERRAQIRRKGADPAGSRWVGGDDRGAQGSAASLP